MTTRLASCRCGALTAQCEGEPVRVSVCHCLNCQQRSGSAFAAQARFPDDRVTISGERRSWVQPGGTATFSFCPTCGATIAYRTESLPGLTAIPLGAFADPHFPPPRFSVWEERRHPWVAILGDEVSHEF